MNHNETTSTRVPAPSQLKRANVRARIVVELVILVFLVWLAVPEKMTVRRAMSDLRQQDTSIRRALSKVTERIAYTKLPDIYDVHLAAARFLAQQGTNATPATSLLIEKLGSSGEIPLASSEALVAIGPSTMPSLLQALETSNPQVRAFATYSLLRITPRDNATLARLYSHLLDKDLRVRRGMFRILAKLDTSDGPAEAKCLLALNDHEDEVRVLAAIMLAKAGNLSADVLAPLLMGKHWALQSFNPNLIGISYFPVIGRSSPPTSPLDSPDPQTWQFALETMDSLLPSDELLIKGLEKLLHSENTYVACVAGGALWRKTQKPELIVSTFVRRINSIPWIAADHWIDLIGEIGPPAKQAIPALTEIANSPTNQLAASAKRALDEITRGPEQNTNGIIRVRFHAIRRLEE